MSRSIQPPDLIHYVESSLFGGSRNLRVQNGILCCSSHQGVDGDAQNLVQPSSRTWRRLWDLLEELAAWDWSGYYGNLIVLDGVNWALDVVWEGRVLEASGYHSWPGKHGEFNRLVETLLKLGHAEPAGWLAGRASM